MEELLKSPKKTAILGLSGSIIILIATIVTSLESTILETAFNASFGYLMIYFSVVLLRIYKKKGDIKKANVLLISSYILIFIEMVYVKFMYAYDIVTYSIFLVLQIVMILYLCNIFFRKIKIINNKVFATVLVFFSVYQILRLGINFFEEPELYLIVNLIKYLGYMTIVPYFYNYYELLKEAKEDGK